MSASRREFLAILAGLPVVFAGRSLSRQSTLTSTNPNDLKVTNYNGDGKYLITEGKTLLVELSFPDEVDDPVGSLIVHIQPESAGGQELTEPQPLFFYRTGDERSRRVFVTAPLDVVEGTYTANISGNHQAAKSQCDIKYFIRPGSYHG